jgi:acyl carrier protein
MNDLVSPGFQEEILALINRTIEEATGRNLGVPLEARLIQDGLLDSLSIVNLVFSIQTTYGVEVDVTEIDEENFGSVASIARLVAARRS